jgi:AcrR family transcriptional regulator
MFEDWTNYPFHILQLEQAGLITRTFRRLDAPRQQAVVQAILDEAAETGPSKINIKRVAQRAGVAVGSLYQYFLDRAAMLDFAIELCVRYFNEMFTMSDTYLKDMPLRESLKLYLSYGVEWGQQPGQAGFLRLFARTAYQGDPALMEKLVQPIAVRMQASIQEILRSAKERGELRPGIDLDTAVRLVNVLFIAIGDSILLPYLESYFQLNARELGVARLVDELADWITVP